MKFLKIITISLGAIAVSSLYLSCAKNKPTLVGVTDNDFSNSSLVQVYDATVSSSRTYVYVDGAPVTGSPLSYGSVFPSGAYAFKVNAGLRSFVIKDTLSATTQARLAFPENFVAGKNYTIYMYDTTPSAKQITIQNDVVFPADTAARVKFANFIYNSSDVPAVDIFSKRINANLFTNISRTMVTDYIPYASNGNDTLLVRETGTTNLLATLNAFYATPRRSYTFIYRGSHRGARVLAAFTNN
ncbi:MAG: DUF4397 domain-containing protein [Bacteroidota bacterium]|nr:DUF4397 domain-containing protein [Bacteroidota bacterium]